MALQPVGYWPADEGKGNVLRDRSRNGNHGTIYSVPWKDGLLAFENDVYQWVQVPSLAAYNSTDYSMGGWVYNALHERTQGSREDEFRFGALIMGRPFVPMKTGKLKWALWGERLDTDGSMLRFGLPDKNGLSLLEIVSGKESYIPGTASDARATVSQIASSDAHGPVEDGIGLQTGEWRHILYSYAQSGDARLYINGRLAHSAKGVRYKPTDTPLVFGGGRWGTFNLGGTLSMAGSLREIVFFDRALTSEEVSKLTTVTKPLRTPTRTAAADPNEQEPPGSPDQLIRTVRDKSLNHDRRAEAALKLAQMGSEARNAVEVLAGELVAIDRKNGAHPPRVEEFFRNALIKSLLEIDPGSERAEALLSEALAKPYFATLDPSRSYLHDASPLIRSGKEMQALKQLKEHFKRVPKLPRLIGWGSSERAQQLDEIRGLLPLRQEYFDRYVSKGIPFADAHYNAYNQIDTRDGSTYLTVVERVDYQEVLDLYDKHLRLFADEKPNPEGKWSRVKIVKIGTDGSVEQWVLMGSWFLYDARDAKMDGWAVALDRDGHIHLLGGQHNRPRQENYAPGTWQKLGIVDGGNKPQVMYWVSATPGEIGSFEFAGQKDNPRSVVGWMNYMNFARDPAGRLFVYGRGRAWSWALLRYEAEQRRWTEIRGSATGMLQSAERRAPKWSKALGNTTPYIGPGDGLVCAFQPGAYNFNRGWGGRALSFDRTGRMHLRMEILGVGENGRMTSGPVYAYSDDQGRTFRAANGKSLRLPLTVNPIPGHDANTSDGPLKAYYDLWESLVKELP